MSNSTAASGYSTNDLTFLARILLDFLPLSLLFGFGMVIVPWVRSWTIQRRYQLHSLPQEDKRLGSTISEIESFVYGIAPNLSVVGNIDLVKQDAFVFPLDFRRAAVVITGKFLLQWTHDIAAAQAILLHEIAHFRRGDVRIIGIGSPFTMLVKYVAPIGLMLFLAPVLLHRISDRSMDYLLGPDTTFLTLLATSTSEYFFWFVNHLSVPIAAIWCAEFTADRFAVETQGASTNLRRILASEQRKSPLKWMLSRLSHPPVTLRIWMLDRPKPMALMILALIFPAAYLARLLFLHGSAVSAYLAFGFSASEIWRESSTNSLWYFRSTTRIWLLMAAFLALWPFIIRGWERLMTGEPGGSSRSNVQTYWLCVVPLLVLAFVGSTFGPSLESSVAAEAETVGLALSTGKVSEAGPAAPGVGESREAPAPLGTEVVSGDLGVAIAQVVQGDEAWTLLQDASLVASEPPSGEEYVLARVQVRNTGDEPIDLDPFQFGLTASGNVVHEVTAEIPPEPWLDMEVAPGGVADGWVVMSVGEDETHRQLVYLGDPFEGQPVAGWRFLALEDDAALPPGELAHPWDG